MTLQEGSRFCSRCGTAVPAATAASTAPPAEPDPAGPDGADASGPPAETAGAPARPDQTVVERFLEADWKSAAFAALPAAVVLLLGALLAAAGLWQSDDAVNLLGQGDLKDAGAGYHNAAATTLAQA